MKYTLMMGLTLGGGGEARTQTKDKESEMHRNRIHKERDWVKH